MVEGATLVDARGRVQGRSVVLADGRIWAVVPAGEVPTWLPRLDASGAVLVPGLIDSHVHLAHAGATRWVGDTLHQNLRATLAFGVLGAQDLGGPLWTVALREELDAGRLLGPRLEVTGPFLTLPRAHPCESTWDPTLCVAVDGDGAGQAQALRAAGVDRVKVALQDADFSPWPSPRLDLEALAEICAGEAIVHVGDRADAADAWAAGCRRLAHVPFGDALTASDAAVPWTELHSTRSAFAAVGTLLGGVEVEDFVGAPEAVRADWAAVQADPARLVEGWAGASAAWTTQLDANLTLLAPHQPGLLPGSDAGYTFVPHGQALHDELEALVAAGLSPAAAFARATRDAALARGWEDQGLVQEGQVARLVLLACDPTQDISCTRQIRSVILGDRAFTPTELLEADLRQAPLEGLCLDDTDCATGACDQVDHRCAEPCAPVYEDLSTCVGDAFCAPADGLDSAEEQSAGGVCHAVEPCDWRAQDCAPTDYPWTCVPRDADTAQCWPAGSGRQGQSCDWTDALCGEGLYCSPVSAVCLRLCEPGEEGGCPGATSCHPVLAEGEPWFGLCW